MALQALKSNLQRLPAPLAAAPAIVGSGRFRHLYKTARWQRIRAEVLLRDNYTCQLCGVIQVPRMVCDHVNGHPATETEEQFWAGPFQAVCNDCHEPYRLKH